MSRPGPAPRRGRGPVPAAWVALLLLLAGPALAAPPDYAGLGVQPYEPPKPAPEFALPDLAGKTVRLADLHGKVVWVFFWATY